MSGITKPFKSMFGMERASSRPSAFDPQTQELTNLLSARVRGESPSLAEAQTKSALDSNLQNTISAIKSSSGISPALRSRMISRAGERSGVDIAQKGGEMRIAEQQSAERNLGSLLTGVRGQDISAFEQDQDRRNFLKDFASGAGSAIGAGGMG